MKYVATAVLLLLLAGCGGDPQPTFSPSPTVVSSATTTAPAVETPQQFLRRWYRVSDRMELTGKTKLFDSLHLESCRGCETYASSVRWYYSRGKRVTGTRTTVLSIVSRGRRTWRVSIQADPTAIVDERGRVTEQLPGGRATFDIGLVGSPSRWRVSSLASVGTAG